MADLCWWCNEPAVNWRDMLGFWWHVACLDECSEVCDP